MQARSFERCAPAASLLRTVVTIVPVAPSIVAVWSSVRGGHLAGPSRTETSWTTGVAPSGATPCRAGRVGRRSFAEAGPDSAGSQGAALERAKALEIGLARHAEGR